MQRYKVTVKYTRHCEELEDETIFYADTYEEAIKIFYTIADNWGIGSFNSLNSLGFGEDGSTISITKDNERI